MLRRIFNSLTAMLLAAFLAVQMSSSLYQKACLLTLEHADIAGAEFREMKLSERVLPMPILQNLTQASGMTAGELLTICYLHRKGALLAIPEDWDAQDFVSWKRILTEHGRDDYTRVSRAYGAVWDDAVQFPVEQECVTYENSWMFERSYGGKRGHEGTDLMPPQNLAGHYRIVSMTDGVVEKIGWLPLGGYRIGIRSPSGGYFYYAHLDSYSRDFRVGDPVQAGEVLGRMGDTGYGKEGTRGAFDVHLHLGIYVAAPQGEISVNPYWVLRYLEYRKSKEG